MAVHSLHIFDRKGKTLFTKRYAKRDNNVNGGGGGGEDLIEQQQQQQQVDEAEQRKLVFGMLFSLRDIVSTLSPSSSSSSSSQHQRYHHSNQQKMGYNNNENDDNGGLHSIRTGATTLYHYETHSGLRMALYITNEVPSSTNHGSVPPPSNHPSSGHDPTSKSIRSALRYIYDHLWIESVTRSPLYRPTQPNVKSTDFENQLDAYLSQQPWFR